jgi:hypothetical protein
MATTPIWWSLPTRGRRPSRTSPTASPSSTASGSATPLLRAVRSVTTTRKWALPPAAPGRPSSGTSASWAGYADAAVHRRRDWRHVRRRLSATACCSRPNPAAGRLRSPPHLPRPEPGPGAQLCRAATPLCAAAFFVGRLRSGADFAGGGVWSRSAKSIPLSPEVRAWLGTAASQMTPPELIKIILQAPVDLLYNGGIGTYVKASSRVIRKPTTAATTFCGSMPASCRRG